MDKIIISDGCLSIVYRKDTKMNNEKDLVSSLMSYIASLEETIKNQKELIDGDKILIYRYKTMIDLQNDLIHALQRDLENITEIYGYTE